MNSIKVLIAMEQDLRKQTDIEIMEQLIDRGIELPKQTGQVLRLILIETLLDELDSWSILY